MEELAEYEDFIKKLKIEKPKLKYIKIYVSDRNSNSTLKKYAENELLRYDYLIKNITSLQLKDVSYFLLKHNKKVLENFPLGKGNINSLDVIEGFKFMHGAGLMNEFNNGTISEDRLKEYQENYVSWYSYTEEALVDCCKIITGDEYSKILLRSYEIERLEDGIIEKFIRNINSETSEFPNVSYWTLETDKFSIEFPQGKFLTNLWRILPFKDFKKLVNDHKLNINDSLFLCNYIHEKSKADKIKSHLKESDEMLEWKDKNQFQAEIEETLKDEYAKEKVLQKIERPDGTILESKFTDFQAFHICKGLKNQRPLYNRYIDNSHSEEDILKAHELANTLLMSHGRARVNFVLSLPSLPFKSENYKTLFSTLDKIRKGGNANPIIRLKLKTEDGDQELEFSFYVADETLYKNRIRISRKIQNRKTPIFDVSRDGTVLPEENTIENSINKNITPILQLFYQLTQSEEGMNEAILSYGRETGRCSVCGIELTNEESIRRGIGPVCESYIL